MPYDAFISYAHDDGVEVPEQLKVRLKRAYFDRHGNRAGADWEQIIRSAIAESTVFFFLITPSSIQSDYCQKEWTWALELQKPIVPVSVKAVDKERIGAKYLEFFETVHRKQYVQPDEARSWQDYYLHLRQARERLGQSFQHVLDTVQYIDMQVEGRPDAVERRETTFIIRSVHMPDSAEEEAKSIEEAWAEYEEQLLLLGEPGAGKTTMLLRHAQGLIADYIRDAANKMPFYANVATWPSANIEAEDGSVQEGMPIAQWIGELYNLPPRITDYIEHGEAVLILDGLDELGSSRPIDPEKSEKGSYDPRARFMKWLQPLIERGDQVLITCRIRDYADIGAKFAEIGAVELKPLTDADIRAYLQNYPELRKTIFDDSALLEICRRPLILSLIAFGFRDAPEEAKMLGSLEAGELRDAIFTRYVETMYDYEAVRRQSKSEAMPFTLEKIWQVLGYAAMVNAAGRYFGTTENILEERDFTHHLTSDEIEAFVQLGCDCHLLHDNQDGSYSFLHLLLRDTFAYSYSIEALRDVDVWVRRFAAQALGKLRDVRAVEPISQALRDVDGQVRSNATEALGQLGDVRAVEPLIQTLRVADERVRNRAAEILGELGDTQAVEPLIQALRVEDSGVRRHAAKALGRLGDVRAVEPLIAALRDEYYDMCCDAAWALGRLGDIRAVAPLIRILRDKHWNVRRSASEALGQLGDTRAVEPLTQNLRDQDRFVRSAAARALHLIGTPEALEAVRRWEEENRG